METFLMLLALSEGHPPVISGLLAQKPVTRSFDVFFDLRLNKQLSKQSRHQWFEMPLCSLWRYCNELPHFSQRPMIWCRCTHENSYSWSRASESCRATELQQKSEGDIKVNTNHMAAYLQMKRLFHSPLAEPWGQAICLPSGLCKETDYQWPFKIGGNSHWSFEPIIHCKLSWIQWSWSVFNGQSHSWQKQLTGGHVSYFSH